MIMRAGRSGGGHTAPVYSSTRVPSWIGSAANIPRPAMWLRPSRNLSSACSFNSRAQPARVNFTAFSFDDTGCPAELHTGMRARMRTRRRCVESAAVDSSCRCAGRKLGNCAAAAGEAQMRNGCLAAGLPASAPFATFRPSAALCLHSVVVTGSDAGSVASPSPRRARAFDVFSLASAGLTRAFLHPAAPEHAARHVRLRCTLLSMPLRSAGREMPSDFSAAAHLPILMKALEGIALSVRLGMSTMFQCGRVSSGTSGERGSKRSSCCNRVNGSSLRAAPLSTCVGSCAALSTSQVSRTHSQGAFQCGSVSIKTCRA